MRSQPLHGTAVARWSGREGWRGVLITGPSGAGKSDLALRLIGQGWRLVADDSTLVFASGGALYATAPGTIRDRLEVRGNGVIHSPARGLVRLSLLVELTDAPVERLPDACFRVHHGVALPLLRLNGFEASAVEKVTVAIAPL